MTRDACFAFHQALSELGIRLDCVDTANAVATFNILSQEGRRVAAALLPAAQDAVVDAPAAAPPRSTTQGMMGARMRCVNTPAQAALCG